MPLTTTQIDHLAPDAASLQAGKGLAHARHWPVLAYNTRVLWGTCKGSGSEPYRTQVDLLEIAFKCSCPSRKFPCKHALGLMLLHTGEPGIFQSAAPEPDWVSEWMNKRSAQRVPPVETVVPADPAEPEAEPAVNKRDQARYASVENAVGALELTLRDLMRTGLLAIPDKGAVYFEKIAARMVDDKAPGLGKMVKVLGALPYEYQGDWHDAALAQVARIWLLLEGFRHLEHLPASVQEDIRALIGWTYKRGDLLEHSSVESVTDRWLIVSCRLTDEDDLMVQRCWLYGMQTRRTALLLDYVHKSQAAPMPPAAAGTALEATLVYYPSHLPQRAFIKQQGPSAPVSAPSMLPNWGAAQQGYAQKLARYPWLEEMVLPVAGVRPVLWQGTWYLQDTTGAALTLAPGFEMASRWKLMAISGGQAVDLMLLYQYGQVHPFGVFENDRYVLL